jgi:hypothetical protein
MRIINHSSCNIYPGGCVSHILKLTASFDHCFSVHVVKIHNLRYQLARKNNDQNYRRPTGKITKQLQEYQAKIAKNKLGNMVQQNVQNKTTTTWIHQHQDKW